MKTNEHFESKIQLLNNYAICLQRQNQSKNSEIGTLHNHLSILAKDNEQLRVTIQQLRPTQCSPQTEDMVCQSLQTSLSLPQPQNPKISVEIQTEEQNDENDVNTLQEEIKIKKRQLDHYHSECEQMYEAIQNLEKCLSEREQQNLASLSKISKLQEKLIQQEQKRSIMQKRFEEVNRTIVSFDQQNLNRQEQFQSMEMEVQSLVMENNRLIERSRQLQREKNNYYHELKKMSRVSFGKEQLASSNVKAAASRVKDQRWKEIEQNLKKLQRENQALQSNLQVAR